MKEKSKPLTPHASNAVHTHVYAMQKWFEGFTFEFNLILLNTHTHTSRSDYFMTMHKSLCVSDNYSRRRLHRQRRQTKTLHCSHFHSANRFWYLDAREIILLIYVCDKITIIFSEKSATHVAATREFSLSRPRSVKKTKMCCDNPMIKRLKHIKCYFVYKKFVWLERIKSKNKFNLIRFFVVANYNQINTIIYEQNSIKKMWTLFFFYRCQFISLNMHSFIHL